MGKGQFICGEKSCNEKESLRTWEINFSYLEQGEKKNTLVKIRLCPSCSNKVNYHTKKREIKRLKRTKQTKSNSEISNTQQLIGQSAINHDSCTTAEQSIEDLSNNSSKEKDSVPIGEQLEQSCWSKSKKPLSKFNVSIKFMTPFCVRK